MWIIQVGSKLNEKSPYKGKAKGNLRQKRQRQRDPSGRDWRDVATSQEIEPLETERSKEHILQGNPGTPRQCCSADTSRPDLQNYERRDCYYFKLPSCGHLLWQLQETNTFFLFAI